MNLDIDLQIGMYKRGTGIGHDTWKMEISK